MVKNLEILNRSTLTEFMQLEVTLKTDRYALAQALGFVNPEAISDLTIDQESISIEDALKADPLDEKETAQNAIDRSFELRQIPYMKVSKEFANIDLLFNWIDPQGDNDRGLGPAMVPQVIRGRSFMKEISLKGKRLKIQLSNKAHEEVTKYNHALEIYENTVFLVENSKADLHRYLKEALATRELDASTLRFKAQYYMSNVTQMENVIATFRIARSKIDRMELNGFYLLVLPHPEDRSNELASRP
jgi:hypothetical protein